VTTEELDDRFEEEVPPDGGTPPDADLPDAGPPIDALDVDELLARLQDAEARHEQALADLRRVAADFDNYRKRMTREHERVVMRAGERIVTKLLPVLDDLGRALEAAEHHEEAKVLEGVRMTRDALLAVLASEGVEEIPTDGTFDPHVHEALAATPGGEGVESGAVLQVVQRGYRLGDAVVRPARVVVAE
jgi:molecular chaperone GrpE